MDPSPRFDVAAAPTRLRLAASVRAAQLPAPGAAPAHLPDAVEPATTEPKSGPISPLPPRGMSSATASSAGTP